MAELKGQVRVWDILFKVSVPLVLLLGSVLVTHEVRLSSIESNRFTNRDAQELERRILAGVPPAWLREDIREIKEGLDRLLVRLRALETKVK